MNRVKIGFFSLSHRSPTGDDGSYLAWHQLDHMPEQYQLAGLVLGQRWASTPACRAARAAEVEGWSLVDHVVCYLMGDPVDETIDEFYALGRHLAELGRFPYSVPAQYRGGLALVETCAAPRALVSPEVVPFRPHRGIYLIVEVPTGGSPGETFGWGPDPGRLDELTAVPGVAGAWRYTTTSTIRRPRFTAGDVSMTVCYLDDDPPTVGARLASVVVGDQQTGPERPYQPVLAAPFESLMSWDWDRFAATDP